MKTIKYIGAADDYTDPVLGYVWDNGQTRSVTDAQWQSYLDAGRFVDATPYQNPVYDVTSTINSLTGDIEISAGSIQFATGDDGSAINYAEV